jgi:hypothetical protein
VCDFIDKQDHTADSTNGKCGQETARITPNKALKPHVSKELYLAIDKPGGPKREKMKHKNIGDNFDAFLEEDGILEHTWEMATKRLLSLLYGEDWG